MNEKLLSKLSDTNLISELKTLVGDERKLTALILRYLCEVRRRRLFAEYGYPSLYAFCMKFLGYTESQTQRRLEAMKVISQVPEVEVKIQEGSLSLTAIAQAQSYFKSQEKADKPLALEIKKEVLKSLENKSTRECERELIKLDPIMAIPKDKVKLISSTHTQTTSTLPNEVLEKLERIKSLLSHKNPNMTQSELLDEMAEIVLNKIDPLRKEIKQRNASMAPIVTSKISTSLKRQNFQTHKGKCSFVSPITGQRCESTFFLEDDHIIPKALGGLATKENLRLFCRIHNQHAAIKVFGLKKMERYLGKKDYAVRGREENIP